MGGRQGARSAADQDGTWAARRSPGASGSAGSSGSDLDMALGHHMRRPMSRLSAVTEHRAHDDRVEQHAERDRDADLGERHHRQGAEHRERAGEHQARPT